MREVPELARLFVIAAHPDDETLGAGCHGCHVGSERRERRRPTALTRNRNFARQASSREAYAAQRAEAVDAPAHVGIGADDIRALSFRDLDACNHLDELSAADSPPNTIFRGLHTQERSNTSAGACP